MSKRMKLPVRNFYKAIQAEAKYNVNEEGEPQLTISIEALDRLYEAGIQAEKRHLGYAYTEGMYEMRTYINGKEKSLLVQPPYYSQYIENNYDND